MPENVPPLSCTITRCPAVASKVTDAFCPPTVVLTGTAGPPTSAVTEGCCTVHACTLIDPAEVPLGLTDSRYVPLAPSVRLSTRHYTHHLHDALPISSGL